MPKYVFSIIRVDDDQRVEFLRESIAGMGRLYERDQVGKVVTEACVVERRPAFMAMVQADPRIEESRGDWDRQQVVMEALLSEYFPPD